MKNYTYLYIEPIKNTITMAQGKFTRAVEFGNDFMKKHPEHEQEVRDYFQLMKDEVEEGGSVENEIDLFIGACNDLLES